jgi:protein-S-isoprenylcysteine O-methyltransferase Ste14
MTLFHNMARIGAVYLLLKGAVFLVAAGLGWTSLPPLLLGGMALTWVAGGILLGWQARRMGRRLAPERPEQAEAEPAGATGRFAPLPHRR